MQNGELREVPVQVDSARGDTTVNGVPFATAYPATTGYAAGESWFTEHEPLLLGERRFVAIALPQVHPARDLARLGEFEGVPLFRFAQDTGRVGVFFVPVRPGCVFQSYVVSYPDYFPRGGLGGFFAFRPWPPPRPTAQVSITSLVVPPDGMLPTLRQVADRLEVAFTRAGYGRPVYFAVPGGFAIVTSAEQFRDGGMPVWSNRFHEEGMPVEIGSVKDIADGIEEGPRGHFRVIAVVVTPFPLTGERRSLASAERQGWDHNGGRDLPKKLADRRLQPSDAVTVIVYEFDRAVDNGPLTFRTVPHASVEAHLRGSYLWLDLARP